MTARYNTAPGRRQTRSKSLAARFEALDDRLAAAERRQQQLKNTVDALAREAGLQVSSPCTHCERGYLLVKNDILFCPACGKRRSL